MTTRQRTAKQQSLFPTERPATARVERPSRWTVPARDLGSTLVRQLDLAGYRLPIGEYAGKTLEEIARTDRGLRMLRFISRGRIPDPMLDAIRAYLATINPTNLDLPV